MSNKRTINISLGGTSSQTSKPNPFVRSARTSSTKSALGFQDDDDDQNDQDSLGPPKNKQIKLDTNQENHGNSRDSNGDDDDGDDAFSKMSNNYNNNATALPPPRKSLLGGDDDDEEDAFSRIASKKESVKEDQKKKEEEEEEEDDPLDAFMAGIDTKVKQEAEMPSEEKVRRDDIEDEDYVESYMKHMKKKGITIGQGGPVKERDEDVDSDEEVYATARAIDNAAAEAQYDLDEMSYDPLAKKEITPLPKMDHSKQDYIELEKCFYEEHDDIANLSNDQVRQIRIDLDMRVSGADVAKPCISFAHFGFEEALIETIRRAGYTEPSGIQRQAIPVALSGRDIIGIAKTGSGKTAAFLLPMIVHIMDQPELEKGDGPIGVVLAPTRELADQIYSEAKRFAKAYGLRVAVVYGGASKKDQFKTLRAGVEIVVATPGRLIDMIKIKATNFTRTSFLVLDEADRVFDLGFEPQVRSICDNIRPDRQTLLFSATFQKRVEKLAREVMTDPVRISIGNVGQINSDVTQVIQILKDDTLKFGWLTERLQEFESLGSVLIFVSRKSGVVELTENLKRAGVKCECLHGDMLQHERDKAVHDYKAKVFPTLIATDVAARGLDIKSIRTVVNYDVARDIDSHVHRVGRTGRAGEKGTAYTLITEKDDRFAGDLVRNLEEFGQTVSPDVMKIAMQNPRFRKSRQFMGGRGGRGGRGDRGGRGGRGRGGHGGRGGRGGGRFHSSGHSEEHSYTSSNNTPLGQSDRRQQGYQAGGNSGGGVRDHDSSSGSGSGYRVSGFQKATRPETGAQEPSHGSTNNTSTGTGQSPHFPPQSQSPSSYPPPPAQSQYGHPPPGFGYPLQNRPPPPQHAQPPWPPRPSGPPPPGFPYQPPPPPGGHINHQHSPYPPPPHHHRPPPPSYPPHGQPPSNPNNSNDRSDRKRRWDH